MADSKAISKTKTSAAGPAAVVEDTEDFRVRISPEAHYALRVEASIRTMTMKEAAEEAIMLWLEKKPKKAGED